MEVDASIGAVAFDLAHIDEFNQEREVTTADHLKPGKCMVRPEPLGVIGVISAWNYPSVLMAGPVTNAISAGNCVIAKPSELSPKTSGVWKKVFDEFLDSRFYRCVEGRLQISIKLTSMRLDKFIFTGST